MFEVEVKRSIDLINNSMIIIMKQVVFDLRHSILELELLPLDQQDWPYITLDITVLHLEP